MKNILILSFIASFLCGCDSFKSVDCSKQAESIKSSLSTLELSFLDLNETVSKADWLTNSHNYIKSSEEAIRSAKLQVDSFDKTKKLSIESCDTVSQSLINLYVSVSQFNLLQNLIIQDVNSSKSGICAKISEKECNEKLNQIYEKELKTKSIKIQKEINSAVNQLSILNVGKL